MSTMSSRRHLLKGAASLGIAGVLGTYHAAVQSAQAAPLDVQRTPIQVTVNSAAFDISGFTLSYEVKGLKAVFDSGLYTPYFEIGSFNARKEFKVFYFIPMDSPRKGAEFIASKDLYRQTVNLLKDDTPGLKAKYSIRLTLRPVRDHYTILRELYVDLPVNIDDAWEPFITDVGSEDLYGSDIYATCRAKVLFLDRQHRFFPKREVTRGDLMEALYRAAESPEAHLPATSPYPDVSTQDARYAAYMWATRLGLTRGWSDGKLHPEAPVRRTTLAAFLYRLRAYQPVLDQYNYPTVIPADITKTSPFYTESVWLHSHVNIDPKFMYKSAKFYPEKVLTREELARTLVFTGLVH